VTPREGLFNKLTLPSDFDHAFIPAAGIFHGRGSGAAFSERSMIHAVLGELPVPNVRIGGSSVAGRPEPWNGEGEAPGSGEPPYA
jgi:hypothetical protein